MQTRPTKLFSIQALRGIAAFLVLIFHIGAQYGHETGAFMAHSTGKFWTQGYAGVDMFFVISGFIMVYVTTEVAPSLQNAGRFLKARITRIYPLWWVVSIIMMAYFWVSYGQIAAPDRAIGAQILPYTIKSWFLWPQPKVPGLGLGWTLIHEVLFYALFAGGLLFTRSLLPIWLGVWAVVIAGASWIQMPSNYADNMWQLFTSPLNLEFILGAFAAMWFLKGPAKLGGVVLGCGVLCLAAALTVGIRGGDGVFLWKRVLVFGLPSAAIILGFAWLEQQGRMKVPNFLVKLGDWSYSLYLIHFIVILAIGRIWGSLAEHLPSALRLGADGALDNILYIALVIILSVIASAMSYRLIERPAMKLLRKK